MKIFIDGSAGTTGLRIKDRLMKRSDVELTTLSEEQRKDTESRKQALNSAQVAFLCLPDAAAVEAVELVENPDTVIIDTSTAHRTSAGWAYGFPELSAEFEDKIKNSKRIAVPGCHAGGFIALVYPLVEAGVLGNDALLSCYSLTGYSGGGKKMIAEYESENKSPLLFAPRQYGLTQQHKHLKEMKGITGIENAPIFCPVVDDFYSGMQVRRADKLFFKRNRRHLQSEISGSRRDILRQIGQRRLSVRGRALGHGRHENIGLRQR